MPTLPRLRLSPTVLFLAGALLLVFGLLVQPLADPDVFIHLRDGRYLLAQHFRVGAEPFAYTVPDKPFETAEWLFRVGAYLTWRLGGFNLLILVKSLLMTAAIGLLAFLVHRRWRHWGATAALIALAMLAPATRLFPERPYVFTYLLLPGVMLLLEDFRRAGAERLAAAGRRLWWIPLAVVPWANLHPGFMVIFGFFGAELAQAAWDALARRDPLARARLRTLAAVSAASLAAGAINPMGPGLYTFTAGMMGSREFMRYILEWAPPTPAGEPAFFVLLALSGLALALNWRRFSLADGLPLAAFATMAVSSYRNIPLFCIAALPRLAGDLNDLRVRFAPRLVFPERWRGRTLAAGGALLLALTAAAAVGGQAFRLGLLPGFYPEHGLRWLTANRVAGRVLTHDIWGGYTGWATEGRVKIFMDGRLPTYGEALYRDYRRMIWGDAETCLPLLRQYQIEAVLVSPKNELKLFQQFWLSGEWALVYWDDVCLLYVRRQGLNMDLAARAGYHALDPKRQPYFDPERGEQALAETRRAQAEAPHSFLPFFFEGDLNLRLGRFDEARRALQKSLILAPSHAATWLDLGLTARRQNRPEEAERCFRRTAALRDDRVLYALACHELGSLIGTDPARRPEALRWARAAVRALPNWDAPKKLLVELQR